MKFHQVCIDNKGNNSQIFLDGEEIKGVRSINVDMDVYSATEIQVTFVTTEKVEIEVNNFESSGEH